MATEIHQQHACAYCGGKLHITRMSCEDCELGYEGDFQNPRLARLSRQDQLFIELFVLSSGSLKRVAEAEDISYPTVRNRLDKLIARLNDEIDRDRLRKQQILRDIDSGQIKPKQGMRMIEAL